MKEIMHVGDTQIRAFSEPMIDGAQIYITGKNLANGKRVYVPSVDFVEVEDSGLSIRPTLVLPFHISSAVQILMDDLWNIGIRPTEGTGSAGAMTATQNHLEDMRKVVFDLLSGKTRLSDNK
jgi:hypothetical protein